MKNSEFDCENCQKIVSTNKFIGTRHRNHCPFCLWSKHVDLKISGDRKSSCEGPMQPWGLTFKHEGHDRYEKRRQGELMIIHLCIRCQKISINRIASDDNPEQILRLLEQSSNLGEEEKNRIKSSGITLLVKEDREGIESQLFGKRWVVDKDR